MRCERPADGLTREELDALAAEGFFYGERRMLKGWRTLIFNAGVAVVGVAQAFDWTTVLGASPYTGWVVTGIGIVGMLLRKSTDTPVGQK